MLDDRGLALLTLSWDKNWDSHSLVNGYPSFYPRISLVAPSPDRQTYWHGRLSFEVSDCWLFGRGVHLFFFICHLYHAYMYNRFFHCHWKKQSKTKQTTPKQNGNMNTNNNKDQAITNEIQYLVRQSNSDLSFYSTTIYDKKFDWNKILQNISPDIIYHSNAQMKRKGQEIRIGFMGPK